MAVVACFNERASEMYTTYPLVNTADNHTGFYLLFVLVPILIAVTRYLYLKDKRDNKLGSDAIVACNSVYVVGILMLVCVGYLSWTIGDRPKNEQVIADLVRGVEIIEPTVVSKGRVEAIPVMFVIYKTPEGDVSFRRKEGYVYPTRVVLYKN